MAGSASATAPLHETRTDTRWSLLSRDGDQRTTRRGPDLRAGDRTQGRRPGIGAHPGGHRRAGSASGRMWACVAYLRTYRRTKDLTAQTERVEMPEEMKTRLRRFLLDKLLSKSDRDR